MNATTERLIFFDLETAGLMEDATIIQIAAVAVDSNLRELESFEVKVRFDPSHTTKKALDVNSFEPTVWKRLAKKPDEAAYDFAAFLREHATVDCLSKTGKSYQVAQLVGHNADRFDGPILQNWYRRLDKYLPASPSVLCTLQRARWLFWEQQGMSPPADFKLGTLCEYFGIPLSKDDAHDALADVRATVKLYCAMMFENFIDAKNAA